MTLICWFETSVGLGPGVDYISNFLKFSNDYYGVYEQYKKSNFNKIKNWVIKFQ